MHELQSMVEALTAEVAEAQERAKREVAEAREERQGMASALESVQREAREATESAQRESRLRAAEHTRAAEAAALERRRMEAAAQSQVTSLTQEREGAEATLKAKLDGMTDRLLSKEAELKEVTDERDILRLRVHTMSIELEAAQADAVVAQLRKEYAASEAARRQSQAEAAIATSTLGREKERGDKALEEVDELKGELAREQARRASDRKAHREELETKMREWEAGAKRLQRELNEARDRLDSMREDYKREAYVADIVNSRGKDAMNKLAADNMALRRELGRLSFRADAATGLRQKDGKRGGGISDLAYVERVAVSPEEANLQVENYVAPGALSEYKYLTAGFKGKSVPYVEIGDGIGDGTGGEARPATTMAATRGGGWVVPGPSPGTAGTNGVRPGTTGTGDLAHSARWREYDKGQPVRTSGRSLMAPTQALGSSNVGAYARPGFKPGVGEGSAAHMAANASVEGRRLGGISPARVRERVEAAGALRDMIDSYQVTIVKNAHAAMSDFVAAGGGQVHHGQGYQGGLPPAPVASQGSSSGERSAMASRGSLRGTGGTNFKYQPRRQTSEGQRGGGMGGGGTGHAGESGTRLPVPGRPSIDWGPAAFARS